MMYSGDEMYGDDVTSPEVDVYDDDEDICEGHPSTSGPIGNVIYCDGSCLG